MKVFAGLAAAAAMLLSATVAEARHRGHDPYGYNYNNGYQYPPGYQYPRGYQHPQAYQYPPGYYGGGQYQYPQAYYGHQGYYGPGYVRCKRRNPAGPAIVGAILGGVIGNSAAHGRDRDGATIAGALIGGALGAAAGSGKKCAYDNGYHGGYPY